MTSLFFSMLRKLRYCVRVAAGIPLVYELNGEMKPIKHYYTASDAEVKAAIDKVANQGKAK